MLSLIFRNIFFTILQPGIVAGLIPFWIVSDDAKHFNRPFQVPHYLGAMMFLLGLVLMLTCILNFAVYGRGTLSPADPTKKLVVRGPYRFSRNPMYVGVMMILIGETIFFKSLALLAYSILIFTAFSIYIRFFEEPRLKRDFGDEYDNYREKVRRWI